MSTLPSSPLIQFSVADDIHPEVQSCRDSVFTPTSTSHPTVVHPLKLSYSPGGSERWTRIVEEAFTPKLKMQFTDFDSAMCFFVVYAILCGFEPRLYTAKRARNVSILRKSIVCNRQGFRDNKRKLKCPIPEEDKQYGRNTRVKRNVKITRIGCPAMMRVEVVEGGGCRVDQFVDFHNHRLLSITDKEFEKVVRKLSYFQKKFIIDNSNLHLGASISFQQSVQHSDGYANVGATLVDFKNFARDVKCFIGLKDATLFVNHLEELAKMKPDFYFAYDIDAEKCLSRVFWADAQSRKNYADFGDCLCYDGTYGTNKYGMIFTPFTGVDHHKRSVTFACCLIDHENEDSFKWCFNKFLDCMGQKEPLCIVTDQAPGILLAVPIVFKTARHRFYMWHIMEKVSSKVGLLTCKDTDFLSRFHAVVWDSTLEPPEFEEKWLAVMTDFNLGGHKWLSSWYNHRHRWIPAYFGDIPMGGLLRTTQRSESSNSFFKRYQTHFGTLVEFWMRYETAIEQQRYVQKCNDYDSEHNSPVTSESPNKIELHAASVYTHKVFYDVQVELKSTSSCGLAGMPINGDTRVYDITDEFRHSTVQVCYTVATHETYCSCKLFESKGLICRHVFWVFLSNLLKSIPLKYIVARWCKLSYRNPFSIKSGNLIEDYTPADVAKMEISNVWSEFYSTISVAKDLHIDRIKELAAMLKCFREKVCPVTSTEVLTKEKEIEQLLGFPSTSEVTILPPKTVRSKGSGKRMLSNRKESIAKAKKPKRLCACCKQMANHDKRNCPQKELDDESSEDDDAI